MTLTSILLSDFSTFVEGQLVDDSKADQQGNGHAYRQSGNIDEGTYFAFAQILEGAAQIDFSYGNIELIDLGYLANTLPLLSRTKTCHSIP